MKIFITGSTGFIGRRVLEQLLASRKHEISALVRSEVTAEKFKARGVEPVIGDLKSLELASAAAKRADAVLHLAFIHDFSKYMESIEIESAFVETMVSSLAGTKKTLIVTSATASLGDSGPNLSIEGGPASGHPRGRPEALALKGLEMGIRVFLLRLCLHVYEQSPYISFMADQQLQAAKKSKGASYIGSGAQKFSVVHVDDAAAAYVAAVSTQAQPGIYHIAGETGITALQLGTAISKKLSIPLHSIDGEEAKRLYGGMAHLFTVSNDVDSSKAQQQLKWKPKHTTGFLDIVAAN